MKVSEVVDKILAYHPHMENYMGCDEYKCGDPNIECTGVVSALVPTVEVIKKTAELGCNLLVTHEVISHQTPDYPDWRSGFRNTVYEEKQKLLKETGIVVWRDHDHMHAHRPDSIFTGVIRYMGWEPYIISKSGTLPFILDIPETTVGELAHYIKDKLNLNGLRYIGRDSDMISRIAFVGHIYPGSFFPDEIGEDGIWHDYSTDVTRLMEEEGVQVLLPGEIIEWTTLSYVRDGIMQGRKLAVYNLGHFNWEELGMKYAADYIRELVHDEVPVHYIPSEDAWSFV